MARQNMRKLLSTTVILASVLLSIAFASSIPSVHAEDLDYQDKTLKILNDIVGLKTELYTISQSSQRDSQYGTFPQKETDISLTSSQSKLRTRCTFVDNELRQIYISELSGSVCLKQPTSDIREMAKSFLQRYQQYTKVSFYSELESMLNDVNIGENATKTQENIKLEVSVHTQARVNFIWTYTDENGVTAPLKNVVLCFAYGMLKSFLDNWHLYTIAGTPTLSREEGIETALEALENFSYDVGLEKGAGTQTISEFEIMSIGEATMCYLNYETESSARNADPFVLYPSWNILLGFDRVYPGGVTGSIIRVWADTGEVSSMKPMVSDGASQLYNEKSFSENLNQAPALLLALLAVPFLIGAAFLCANNRKKVYSRLKFRGKIDASVILGSLLLTVLSTGIILPAIPRVDAVNPWGKANLDASMFNQITLEKMAGTYLIDYIDCLFDYNGYTSTSARVDDYTTSTTISNVLGNISSAQQYYCAVEFHFGHAGQDPFYYDTSSEGEEIWYTDVNGATNGKHYFVMLWACRQGNSPTYGMPVAWTKRTDLASDGYLEPDSGPHCFIGFWNASAGISNSTGSFQNYTNPGKNFIMEFYYHALVDGYSINEALDAASNDFFGLDYIDSPLREGFNTWWPGNWGPNATWALGKMSVYGNGNIKLYQPLLSVNARDSNNNPVSADVYIDEVNMGTTGNSFRVAPGYHWIRVSSSSLTFRNFTNYSEFQNPVQIQVTTNTTVTANYYVNPPPEYTLSISSGEGGTTDPQTGNHQYSPQSVSVTADPDSEYVFDYWLLDNEEYTQNPIYVPMSGNHTLQANFREAVSYWLSLDAYDDFYLDELDPDVWVDSNWVGTAPVTVQVTEGYHYIEVTGYIWNENQQFYDCFDQFEPDGYSQNPSYIFITGDTELTAWYMQEGK